MNRTRAITGLATFIAVFVAAPMAFASEGAAAGGGGMSAMLGLGCVIGLGIAAGGCGIGMGNTVSGSVNAMARNPGFYPKIFMNMMIGLALIEGFVIYTLVIVFLFMYANPFLG